jgi:hypothetical protein
MLLTLSGCSSEHQLIAQRSFLSLSSGNRCQNIVQLFGCCARELSADSSSLALQIFKMTTETAYDAKAYDQKMQDL